MSFGIRIEGLGGPTGGGITPDTRTINANGVSNSNPVFGDEPLGSDRIEVSKIFLHINADPGSFIDTETTLYLYSRATRRGEDICFKQTFRSVYSEVLNDDWLTSENTQDVDSPGNFQGDDLIFLMGNPEYSRIRAVNPPQIITFDNPVAQQNQNTGISKVLEVGSFVYFDRDLGELLRWRIETITNVAADYTLEVEYLNL